MSIQHILLALNMYRFTGLAAGAGFFCMLLFGIEAPVLVARYNIDTYAQYHNVLYTSAAYYHF